MTIKAKITTYLIAGGVAFALGMVVADYIRPPVEKKIEFVEVEKVVERVRTVTKIKESPDGTKETIIVEESESEREWNQRYKEASKPAKKDWIVGTMFELSGESQRYGLQAHRHQLLGFYLGGYITAQDSFKKPAFGVSLSYSF